MAKKEDFCLRLDYALVDNQQVYLDDLPAAGCKGRKRGHPHGLAIECLFCKIAFKHLGRFNDHWKTNHETLKSKLFCQKDDPDAFHCKICKNTSTKFRSLSILTEHLRTGKHTPEECLSAGYMYWLLINDNKEALAVDLWLKKKRYLVQPGQQKDEDDYHPDNEGKERKRVRKTQDKKSKALQKAANK
jgi:hypothetical protein